MLDAQPVPVVGLGLCHREKIFDRPEAYESRSALDGDSCGREFFPTTGRRRKIFRFSSTLSSNDRVKAMLGLVRLLVSFTNDPDFT